MKTVIEMAREAGMTGLEDGGLLDNFLAFAELVRADERNRTWTQEHWTEYEHSIAAAEREACAKYLNDQNTAITDKLAAEIRARSNT